MPDLKGLFADSVQKTCTLDESTLDEIVLLVQENARSAKVDGALSTQYGFLIDNVLDYWLRYGGRGRELKVSFGRRFLVPYVCIEMTGDKLDPYPVNISDFGSGGSDIGVYASNLPEYDYRDGTNVIFLRLKREPKVVQRLLLVAFAAVLAGVLGNLFMSEQLRAELLSSVVDPIIDMFFNLLRCIAGPMIFLSVTWGICGIGDSRMFGRVGKAVLLYSIGITAVGAVVGAFSFPFLGNGFAAGGMNGKTLSSLFEMILGVVPTSIVEPFLTGNTLQIIFMAIAMSIAMITRSSRVRQIVAAADQFNLVVQRLMGAISKLVPYIVFLLIMEMIWNGSLSLVVTMWKFFLVMMITFIVIEVILCTHTALRQKTGFLTLAKKNLSTFVISLTTASSAASFGSNLNNAKKRFGIADDMASFSVPLGIIMLRPINAAYFILLAVHFAAVYGVPCSFGWLVGAVIVSTILSVATPPVPGGAAAGYAILFAQLGVPDEALAVVLVMDVITDFIITALDCYIMPISLINISAKMGQLNETVLKDENK